MDSSISNFFFSAEFTEDFIYSAQGQCSIVCPSILSFITLSSTAGFTDDLIYTAQGRCLLLSPSYCISTCLHLFYIIYSVAAQTDGLSQLGLNLHVSGLMSHCPSLSLSDLASIYSFLKCITYFVSDQSVYTTPAESCKNQVTHDLCPAG